ncbi:hypothetical protein TVAG_412540 [Trichomonas vaginalis G3]|uniref:Uncharacterized protein n=1 Tax=Trichomonas vaginalis (strain ATCC PRA-98 / G3) TaxID=412133 RepID=A2EV67_TRIV3|nr:hypothetical protein TVAGG3_0936050 [Trichomonas vaginalis G3]EAY03450.1 hypothetical protein TVAG_412540 [Trichomonas vaginalis G3]KAI5486184.1 hypothetical protein TVAGG3_0936050 [Trichomonas vaginalis G3]|eukprot:XP_001315673.1 hypothetical protein [Trichomonas vaginalis G3]
MNPHFDPVQIITECFKLSNLFEMMHSGQGNQIQTEEELELNVVLPFLVLNAKEYRPVFSKLKSKPSFRIQSMIAVHQAPIEPIPDEAPQQSIDSLTDGQKVAYLKRDLDKQTRGEPIELFNFQAYSRYLADIFPILYNRFKAEVPFITFVTILLGMDETAILSTCFAFPHFITPLFMRLTNQIIRIKLAVLAPQFRPILLQQLVIDPKTLSVLYVHYFGINSPSLLLEKFDCNFQPLTEAIEKLLTIKCDTKAYYLCIARMCACLRSMNESEAKVLIKCPDTKFLCSLFFYIHVFPPTYINTIIDYMCAKKESFIDMMLFFSNLYFDNTDLVAQWITTYLGKSFNTISKGTFFHELSCRPNLPEYVKKYVDNHPKALSIIGSTLSQSGPDEVREHFARAIGSLTEVTSSDFESINKFMQALSQNADLPDIIEEIVSDKPFFDVQYIKKNPAPATAACLLVMMLNSPRKRDMLQHIPVRLILSACSKYEVFFIFCDILRTCFPFADDERFLSLSMDDITTPRHPREVLEDIRNNPDSISDELYEEWSACHFISSFDFVLATLKNLGAPMRLTNLQFVFQLKDSVLHHKNSLKIVLTCTLDIIHGDENVEEASVCVCLCDAVDRFSDSRIDREVLGWFISILIRAPKRFILILSKEFPVSMSKIFAKYIKLTDSLANELLNGINTFTLSRYPTILSLMIAYSETKNKIIAQAVSYACQRLEAQKETNLDKVDTILIVQISKMLCELAQIYLQSIQSVQHLILTFQDRYATILSSQQKREMDETLNNLTASLFKYNL